MKAIETEYSTRDGGHYVPAMEHNGILYVSGQLSIDPTTGQVPAGGVADETGQALANLELVLTAAGLTRHDVIMCRLYTPNVENWPTINAVYSAFFGDHRPARVVIPTTSLYAGCQVEVEAVVDATRTAG